jgi:hypothetical protein
MHVEARQILKLAAACAVVARLGLVVHPSMWFASRLRELADEIERMERADHIRRREPASPEWNGPQAARAHALCAPSLAKLTAACSVQDPEGWWIDEHALVQRISCSGTDAQTTLAILGFALAGDQPTDTVTLDALLGLEDTDLAHALEAIALCRKLRRVYPRQCPDLLWVQASMSEGRGP